MDAKQLAETYTARVLAEMYLQVEKEWSDAVAAELKFQAKFRLLEKFVYGISMNMYTPSGVVLEAKRTLGKVRDVHR